MLVLRAMTPADTDGKGFVHYQSWQETYAGLVDENYLARMSVEKCRAMAHRYPESTIVAELNGKIVGFSCYGPCRTPGCEGMGEVMAIYILKEAQGLGIGRKLMDAGIVLGYGTKEERLDRITKFAAHARKLGLERVEEWKITPDQFITNALAALEEE